MFFRLPPCFAWLETQVRSQWRSLDAILPPPSCEEMLKFDEGPSSVFARYSGIVYEVMLRLFPFQDPWLRGTCRQRTAHSSYVSTYKPDWNVCKSTASRDNARQAASPSKLTTGGHPGTGASASHHPLFRTDPCFSSQCPNISPSLRSGSSNEYSPSFSCFQHCLCTLKTRKFRWPALLLRLQNQCYTAP